MQKNIIYGLFCPFTGNLHYIGKSTSYMTRPIQHLAKSHSEKIQEWVSELRLLGHKPIIKILDSCNENELDDLEIKLIAESKNNGNYLLNCTHNKVDKIILKKEYNGDNSDMIGISKAIKETRKRLKITTTTLAKLSNIDRTTIYHIEKASDQIVLKNLRKILNSLNLKIIIVPK